MPPSPNLKAACEGIDVEPFEYHVPTRIIFGTGAIHDVHSAIAEYGQRPFVVTGRSSSKLNGSLDTLLEQCPEAVVFDETDENPTDALCEKAAEICVSNNCDMVVGLGGGSPIDTAKAVAVLAANGGACSDYYGTDQFAAPPLPIIAIPTTAGAGSEVTPYSVVVDTTENTKRTMGGTALFPKVALLDPELTVTLPQSVTLHTGLDVLSQGMEGLVSKKATPMSDVIAIEVCRLVYEWLPVAQKEPANLEARSQMLYAAMLSGCVVAQTGTTLVHGMGYLYTVECGIAHGLANALLLTPLFRENAKHCPQQVAAIAKALGTPVNDVSSGSSEELRCDGVSRPSHQPDPERVSTSELFPPRGGIKGGVDSVDGTRAEDIAEAITQALHNFLAQLGISPAARDHGLHESQISAMAAKTHTDPSRFKNQYGTFTQQFIEDLYRASLKGS
jgi:alcohol dehydrogenase